MFPNWNPWIARFQKRLLTFIILFFYYPILYCRDHYFDSRSISEAAIKPQQVAERLEQILQEFSALETGAVEENRARFLYLKGKLLNVTGEFSSQVSSSPSYPPTAVWCIFSFAYWFGGFHFIYMHVAWYFTGEIFQFLGFWVFEGKNKDILQYVRTNIPTTIPLMLTLS